MVVDLKLHYDKFYAKNRIGRCANYWPYFLPCKDTPKSTKAVSDVRLIFHADWPLLQKPIW
jgi:hypothetical protein